MLVMLRSKHAALLYDGKKTEDKPVSQKEIYSECAVEVTLHISLVTSEGLSPPSGSC